MTARLVCCDCRRHTIAARITISIYDGTSRAPAKVLNCRDCFTARLHPPTATHLDPDQLPLFGAVQP